MSKKRFANVWDAIEDTPAQAENMKLRSALMSALKANPTHGCSRRAYFAPTAARLTSASKTARSSECAGETGSEGSA